MHSLALLAELLGSSLAQSPREPPRQNPEPTQQRPEINQRDTDQSPFIIQIQPATNTQEKTVTRGGNGPRV
jgi:hypothetical protein